MIAKGQLISKCLLGFTVSTKIETKVSRKPQRRYKKFQDRNPYNISVAYLVEMMTAKRRFEINWPLSLLFPWLILDKVWFDRFDMVG